MHRTALLSLTFLAAALAVACSDGGSASDTWPVQPDSGLRAPEFGPVPALPNWPDNPPTAAKAELGRAIYFDARLSGSGTVTCSTCHFAAANYQSNTGLDLPDRSLPGTSPPLHRHTPSLLNLIYAPVFRWDGSHGTDLYHQLSLPFAEANMNLTPGIPAEEVERVEVEMAKPILVERLTETAPGYIAAFEEAFGEDIREVGQDRVWTLTGMALANYLRLAVSRDSAFDAWNAGDDRAMSDEAVRGFKLFVGKAGCATCHNGPFFTDFQFHNISTSPPDESGKRHDDGYYLVSGDEADRGAFLTPTLRSVARSQPYFHHGKAATFAQVILHKTTSAVTADPLHSPLIDSISVLTDDEIGELAAFLEALDGAPLGISDTAPPSAFP